MKMQRKISLSSNLSSENWLPVGEQAMSRSALPSSCMLLRDSSSQNTLWKLESRPGCQRRICCMDCRLMVKEEYCIRLTFLKLKPKEDFEKFPGLFPQVRKPAGQFRIP